MQKNNKLLGIIGGMGAEAGAAFYARLVDMTPAEADRDHIRTILYSNTAIPDRTLSILGEGEDPLPALLESAKLLEGCGVDLIVMACVAAHHYIRTLRESVSCDFLSAVETAVWKLDSDHPEARTVGILATTGTLRSGMFQDALRAVGRETLVLPGDLQESLVMGAVYGPDGIKAGRHSSARKKVLEALAVLDEAGADAIILGCSELPLVVGTSDWGKPLIDAVGTLLEEVLSRFK